ncbi:hypothetical protein IV203_023888 [Nitzschia inconspicua]|uniref:Uncharacterized protein n=1 Tax=Nitzschia inconspicua TaxID=303405 RepID=A0A9K3PAX9_9STRA|nr:hypothetical protein IV203_023888 [Nitzschia inconspicua]
MEDEMPPEIIKLKDPPPTAPPVVEFIEWEDGIELAPIVPDFDDEAEDLDDDVDDDVRSRASGTRGGPSMMKLVMQAILARLLEELTRTKRRAATPPDLTMYLKRHGFWIRAESFPEWSKFTDLTHVGTLNPYYLRDIRVWIPEIECGGLMWRFDHQHNKEMLLETAIWSA